MRSSPYTLRALVLLSQIRWAGCMATEEASVPAPISFQPSNYWDGNDGAWSTFAFQIGTPPQAVRLLPSITSSAIWTVWSYACELSELTNCDSVRGDTFNFSASSTWDNEGNYSLPLNPQHYLPYSGGAVVGFDNTTLDWQGHGGKSLARQMIFAFATDDFYVGSFGLSPRSINVSSYNDQIPSILGSLRQDNLIPSTSWGYLAGASYYSYPITGFGSLTLGGYDASQFNAEANLTLAGGSDPYRPFLLGIESITTQETEMLAEPIITALDSLTTQIWLPKSACQAFEAAFGIVWNETHELYLLDDEEHSALVAKNASVTFVLSTGISNSTDRLNITLPYAAFDLKASPPLAGNQTYFYFPLKQAANETQYTLGRTILQEIYMIADYERGSITLYEASYSEASVKSAIVTICPLNSSTCLDSTSENSETSHKLSVGATAGIVVAVVLALAGICTAIWLKFFRKPPMTDGEWDSAGSPAPSATYVGVSVKPELGGEGVKVQRRELESEGVKVQRRELEGEGVGTRRSELEDKGYYRPGEKDPNRDSGYTSPSVPEMGTSSPGVASPGTGTIGELPGGGVGAPDSMQPSELPGNSVPQELPGSTSWPSQVTRRVDSR